jgi:hypothetical protein
VQQLAGAAQVLEQVLEQHLLCLPNSPPPKQLPNLRPPQKDGAPQVGAQFVGQQLLATGAAHAGAQAAGAGQQLLAAGAAHAGAQAAGAGQQLLAGAAQAGAQAAAGAQQAGAGQHVAGAAQVLPQPWLCLPSPPNRPHFDAGAQQDDGQHVSQHGGLMSEQRR